METLIKIGNEISSTMDYIDKLVGAEKVLIITDDKTRISVQENIVALKGVKKSIIDYFKPLKEQAKQPYQKLLDEEKEWVESVENPINFMDKSLSEYNQKERERLNAIRRAELEKEAQEERERLEKVKEEALKAGNTEAVQEIETEQKNIIVDYIPDVIVKARSEGSTMTEQSIIEEFQITDQLLFIQACIDGGMGNLLKLDKTTETAIKKHLVNNPSIKALPGCYIKRGYKNDVRGRK